VLSGVLFPLNIIVVNGEKGTVWENEQSIYGVVAGELNSLEEFSSVLRDCFIFFSL